MAIGTPTTLGTAQTPGASGNSLSLTTSASAPNDSLIIVVAGWGSDTGTFRTGTMSGGGLTWALDKDQQFSGAIPWSLDVFSAPAPSGLASSTSLTLNLSGQTFGIIMAACYVTGLDLTGTRLDVTDGNGANTSNWDTTATSTTVADTLVFGGCIMDGTHTNTATGGATELHDFQLSASGWTLATEYKILSSAASTSLTGTMTGGPSDTSAAFAAYKAAAVFAGSFPQARPLLPMLHKMGQLRSPWWPFPEPALEVPAGGITYNKAGDLTVGVFLSGADVYESAETGSLTPDTLLSGTDVAEHAETGSLLAGTILSGGRIRELAGRAGSLIVGAFLSGADAATVNRTGSLLTKPLLSGTSLKESAGKAGSLTAGTQLRGADASEHARQNALATFGSLSGADANVFSETGSLTPAAQLRGPRVLTLARAGLLAVGTFLSGLVERPGLPAFVGRMGSRWSGTTSSDQTGRSASGQTGRTGTDV